MPDFASFKGEFGRDISMALTPPAPLKVLCRGAVFRNLERESGERYGVGHRLRWDVVEQHSGSSKISDKSKACMRAQATYAVRTGADAVRAGYAVSDRC
eukprot:9214833-Pyramimonas_sp.AAC.1